MTSATWTERPMREDESPFWRFGRVMQHCGADVLTLDGRPRCVVCGESR